MTAAIFAEWPKYAERILGGAKRYEYRKVLARHRLGVIYIYETAPVSAVVGMVEVVDQGYQNAVDLWLETLHASGMDEEEWHRYVGNSEIVAYYELAHPHRFPQPIPLSYFGLKSVPQSYAYVPEELDIGQLQMDVMAP